MNIVIDPQARQWLLERGGQFTLSPPASQGG